MAGAAGGTHAAVVAAARWEAGRVVVMGHGGYFGRGALETADTGRMLRNALRWAAAAQGGGPLGDARIGVAGSPELRDWLLEQGSDAADITLTPESLATVDVVAVEMWNQPQAELDALAAYLRAGGGLVSASTGWGWAQLHPARDLVTDYAGNRLLAAVGLQWPYDWLSRTADEGYAVDGPPPELMHAGLALAAVEAHAAGTRTLEPAEIDQALDSLVRAATCLPPDDSLLAPRLRALVEGEGLEGYPTAHNPVGKADVLRRVTATLYVLEQRRAPAEAVTAHPAALDFPGPVPSDAPRLRRRLRIDTSVPRWHSTGLYAAPGERVTVTVPAAVAEAGGYHVRVGAHSDGIWGRPHWTRMPEISRRYALSSPALPVANAFGGLIYLEVPDGADQGEIEVAIEGAVEAPRFVLGETDPATWRERIRHAPAPWAEIEGHAMIVTAPANEVRDLDDPAAVARAWDHVLALSAELAAWPPGARAYPERFVVDRLISVGYMHAGYPLMAHLDQQSNLVDAGHVTGTGNWGFFHEVGHNHQHGDWTFGGTVEVTVNLFTLYVFERLVGIPVAEHDRGSDAFLATQMARYDFDDPDFARWQREPFLALAMYVQLQRAFGWQAYIDTFAAYRALPADERPRGDAEERDQWMLRFSRTVGRDLGPFFAAWGIPVGEAARASIADLPGWMPEGFPPGGDPDPAAPTPLPSVTPLPTVTAPPTSTPRPTYTPMPPRVTPAPPTIYLPLARQEMPEGG